MTPTFSRCLLLWGMNTIFSKIRALSTVNMRYEVFFVLSMDMFSLRVHKGKHAFLKNLNIKACGCLFPSFLLSLVMPSFTEITTFCQRFIQHFEPLLRACLPDQISYFSFKETINNARLSVSVLSYWYSGYVKALRFF